MADSVREQVLAAAWAAVAGLSGIRSAARNPDDDWSPEELDAIAQLDGGMERNAAFSGQEEYWLDWEVQVWVAARTPELVTAAVDARYRAIVAAIQADATLGGLVSDGHLAAMSEVNVMREGQEKPFAQFGLSFRALISHAENDPTALA